MKSFLLFQGESLEVVASKPPVNHPRIAAVVSDGSTEYFVICEQKAICKVEAIKAAVFTAFAAYVLLLWTWTPQATEKSFHISSRLHPMIVRFYQKKCDLSKDFNRY